MRTARHVRDAAEQSLLGLRVLGHVKELFDIRRDHLATLWTCDLCLWHSVISDFLLKIIDFTVVE
jgi:hypothetical protein